MFTKETYVNRRNTLKKKMTGNGLILMPGNSDASMNYPANIYKFRQDSTFLYYFGLNDPDFAAVIDLESGEETIFGNNVTMDDIIWMGPQPTVSEKAESAGVRHSRPFSDLESVIKKAIAAGRKIHYLPPYRAKTCILLNGILGIPFENLREQASMELIKACVSMREIKEPCEIDEIDHACNIGYAMHMTVMKMAKLGMREQELAGLMEGISMSHGSMPSFPIILSQHGETLHNNNHNLDLEDGKLLLIDAGAESNMNYCSDFTRTFPSSSKFTQKQKDIYNIVATANNLGVEMSRPGLTYKEVHLAACKVLAQGLINLGLMKGNVDEAVAAGAHALFMPHGLGHQMGMDVHDMEGYGETNVGYDEKVQRSSQFGLASLRMGKELRPGHVVTVEPGCYFIPALIEKWKTEGINKEFINFDKLEQYYDFGGIRIEDDILITENGCRILGSKRLPNTPEAVEAEMAG